MENVNSAKELKAIADRILRLALDVEIAENVESGELQTSMRAQNNEMLNKLAERLCYVCV